MAMNWFRGILFLKFYFSGLWSLRSISLPDDLPLYLCRAVKAHASEIQSNNEQKGYCSLKDNSESPIPQIREAKRKRIYFFFLSDHETSSEPISQL